MTPDGKDVYRWRYSVNLYKNLGLLWLFYKVFGGIFAGCLLDYITSRCPKLKKKAS